MPVNTEVTSPKSTNRREHRRRRPRKYPDWRHDVISHRGTWEICESCNLGKERQVWRRSRLEILTTCNPLAQRSTQRLGEVLILADERTRWARERPPRRFRLPQVRTCPRQHYEARSESDPFSQMPSPQGQRDGPCSPLHSAILRYSPLREAGNAIRTTVAVSDYPFYFHLE
jgi:hypothetical protein